MCGIFAILESQEDYANLRTKALKYSKKLRHRGPDWNGISLIKSKTSPTISALAHERLAIVDLQNGAQPLFDREKKIFLCVNGEIYNHSQIRDEFTNSNTCALDDYEFSTGSDCESIIPLYIRYGVDFMKRLDGIFAFILYDTRNDTYIAARDPIGVCSFYIGWHHSGSIWFASEMKALDECTLIQEFPPGEYFTSSTKTFTKWYSPKWLVDGGFIPSAKLEIQMLRKCLESSVIKRMMTDVPFGVLLSGGLDSSIIAAIVARHLDEVSRSENMLGYTPSKLITFSIGLKGSPDLEWAEKVAKHIKSEHQSFVYSVQEGIDALEEVIAHIETYDVTTVRASTPMFLMARRIKAMGIKMVLSGEGSDEIFGGYLYFHKAPSPSEFHQELVRKISALSKYDCLRANKSMAAWGVEVRVPFLDKIFLDYVMSLDPKYKIIDKNLETNRMEKQILRLAFDGDFFLPSDVLWRQKEQFSDGVGYSWIDGLKDHASKTITDQQFSMAPLIYPYNTPKTKEAYLYRSIFESLFPKYSQAKTVPSGESIACSSAAALKWDSEWANKADPSGRAVTGVHVKAN